MANTRESEHVLDHFPQIIEALQEAAKVAVRQVAQGITQEANSAAPHRTGALAASGYYVASDISTYGQAVAGAQSANDAAKMLPEVEHPESETEATVAYAAEYALFLHDGTRHIAARPWLAQTAEGASGKVADTVAQVIGAAIERAGI